QFAADVRGILPPPQRCASSRCGPEARCSRSQLPRIAVEPGRPAAVPCFVDAAPASTSSAPPASERTSAAASAARAIAAVAWLAAIGAPLAIGAAWLVRTDPHDAGPLEAAAVFAALL